jgi:hypothetical protein
MNTTILRIFACAAAAMLVATAGAQTVITTEPGTRIVPGNRTIIIDPETYDRTSGTPLEERGTGSAAGASSDHGLRSGSTSSDNGQGIAPRRVIHVEPGVRRGTTRPDNSAAGVGHVSTGTGDSTIVR